MAPKTILPAGLPETRTCADPGRSVSPTQVPRGALVFRSTVIEHVARHDQGMGRVGNIRALPHLRGVELRRKDQSLLEPI